MIEFLKRGAGRRARREATRSAALLRAAAVGIGLSVPPAPSSLAAQAAGPFSTFDLSGAIALDVRRERLHELWRPGHGGLVRVSTPFYAGAVAISGQLAYFRSRAEDEPDFRAITRVAEWNAVLSGHRGVEGFVGMQVGAIDMEFLGSAARTDNPDENELLVGAQAGIAARVHRRVGLTFMASRQRVFTHVPIDLTYTSAGMQYRVRTPAWLREVLE